LSIKRVVWAPQGQLHAFANIQLDICDELDIDLAFLAEENHSNGTNETGPVAEGAAAAA
jgi:hypothetical protein